MDVFENIIQDDLNADEASRGLHAKKASRIPPQSVLSITLLAPRRKLGNNIRISSPHLS
jgi:hypothetical protein